MGNSLTGLGEYGEQWEWEVRHFCLHFDVPWQMSSGFEREMHQSQ